MTSARKINELVDALRQSDGGSSESITQLDLHGSFDQVQLSGWAEVVSALPFTGVTSITALDELGEEVDLSVAADSSVAQNLRVRILKATSSTTAFCLTAEGVSAVFSNFDVSAEVHQVWVACEFEAFQTDSCRVDPWGGDAAEVPKQESEARIPDPRRLVKDFVGGRVPKSVRPHLLASRPPASSAVFEKWKALAVVRLLHCLVNEVVTTGVEQVVITGTRPRKIDSDLKGPFSEQLFLAATDAARWVYASGRDADARFILFTCELSREWPDLLSLKDGFTARGELALEGAKTAFNAYIQETSKDTLKSLGDLRKTLSEEVTKVVSQTRDLLGTMWRDFMVAATAFFGRVVLLGADKPLSNPGPLKALLSGAAVFLIFSLYLSLRTNGKFMTIADVSRAEWRRKLYGFVTNEDFKRLAETPISQSMSEYSRVVGWVVAAYVAVIACLLASSWGDDLMRALGPKQPSVAPAALVAKQPKSAAPGPAPVSTPLSNNGASPTMVNPTPQSVGTTPSVPASNSHGTVTPAHH